MNWWNPLNRIQWAQKHSLVAPGAVRTDPSMTLLEGISPASEAAVLRVLSDGVAGGPFFVLQRESAMGFTAFARSITLISSLMAQLITRGSLYVMDMETKRRVRTGHAKAALSLLSESHDGMSPSYPFIEDLVVDYLMEGNCLVVPARANGQVTSMMRGIASLTERMSRGVSTLRIPFEDGSVVSRARRDVILVRWPRTYSPQTDIGRIDFAPSNLDILRNVLHIGLAADEFIAEFFKATRGKRHLNFAVSIHKNLTPDQLSQFKKAMDDQAQSGGPYVFGDASITNLNEKASSTSNDSLRKMQVRQVSSFYGVPPILVGEEATSWGSGIEELSRGFVRYGLILHLTRFLEPFSFFLLPRGQKFGVEHADMVAVSIDSLTKLAMVAGGDTQRAPIMVQDEIRNLFGMAPSDELPTTPYKPPQPASPLPPQPGASQEDE